MSKVIGLSRIIGNCFSRLEIQEENNDWIEYSTVVDSLATTIKDLKPGVTYRFRVRAENAHGRSDPSDESEEIRISLGNEVQPVFDEDITVKPGGDFKTRFLLQEELGKGRFGVVHKVVEIETDRTLAAKIVKCIKAVDKQKVNRSIDQLFNRTRAKVLIFLLRFKRKSQSCNPCVIQSYCSWPQHLKIPGK